MQDRKIDPAKTPERERYYQRIAQQSLYPLWERLSVLLTPEPQVDSQAFAWDYETARDMLLESAGLISPEEAERRVLILENPGLEGQSAITESLYAGWQLLLPGEVAPSHRHSPSALRFILEGDGKAYTAVDGEKAYMEPGDMILTPSMRWHDHGHEGTDPVVWLDVLDLPLVRKMGPIFIDFFSDERFPDKLEPGTNRALQAGLKPVTYDAGSDPNSPVFHYPYKDMKAALLKTAKGQELDPRSGIKMEYVNPMTGGPAMVTISTFLQWMPSAFSSVPCQTTEGMVVTVVEGTGSLDITGKDGETRTMKWKPKDTLVIPCWAKHSWKTETDTVLFTASDRGVLERMGLLREQAAS